MNSPPSCVQLPGLARGMCKKAFLKPDIACFISGRWLYEARSESLNGILNGNMLHFLIIPSRANRRRGPSVKKGKGQLKSARYALSSFQCPLPITKTRMLLAAKILVSRREIDSRV